MPTLGNQTLPDQTIARLVAPYYPDPPSELVASLSIYLDLLLKWNARTNLTAIRDPAEMVTRHFGESLFAARSVPSTARTLLDLGSGAGFPGAPIQLVYPELAVTLAESQNKKAAFLQELVRTLSLKTRVWAGRVEDLPRHELFDCVALRAVDNPDEALGEAWRRLAPGGTLLHLTVAKEAKEGASGELAESGIPHVDSCLPSSSTVLRKFIKP